MSSETSSQSKLSEHSQTGSMALSAPFASARVAPHLNWYSRPLLLCFLTLTLTLFLPPPWLVLGYGSMLAYYGMRWVVLGSAVPNTRVNLYILVLLFCVLLSLVVTPTPLAGAVSAAKLLAAISCFYILTDFIQTPDDAWFVAAGLVALGLVLTLLIPFYVEWSLNKVYALPWLAQFNPPTTGINPNVIAGMLAVILPLAISLLFSKRWRILGAVSVISLVLGLIVLQSRGALFAAAGGLVLAATALRRWFLPLLMLLVVAGFAANFYLGGDSLAPYVLGRVGTATSGTTMERLALWRQAFDLIRSNPLAGIGIGAYPSVAPFALPYSPAAPGLLAYHAHNLFLQMALDIGLPGLVAFIVILVRAIVSAWRAHMRGILSPLALGVLGALGIVAVHGLVDSVFWGFRSSMMLGVLFALALALQRLGDRDISLQRHEGQD